MLRIIISIFVLGLSFGSGPCLVSCGPLLISYIAATKRNALRAIFVYILFSLARISVYVILSLLVFFLGRFAVENLTAVLSKYIFIVGGIFIGILGVFVAWGQRWESYFCRLIHKHILVQDKKSVFILGLIIGLLPCLPLITILSYIGLISKSWSDSLLYSLSFGLGTFVSPLILLVMLTGLIPKLFLDKQEAYSRYFNLVCGVIMIILGLGLIRRGF